LKGVEHVRFDTQAMQQTGISGVEYQQGTLAGYEVREYLLEKWDVLSRGDGYTYHTRARCSSQLAPFLPTARAGGLLKP
jgi:hypothetical protein